MVSLHKPERIAVNVKQLVILYHEKIFASHVRIFSPFSSTASA